MKIQKETARNARVTTNYMGADATVYDEIDSKYTSTFVGYDKTSHKSIITVLTTETEITDEVVGGQNATIIVEETPFYATMGGQEGDVGTISKLDAEFVVEETVITSYSIHYTKLYEVIMLYYAVGHWNAWFRAMIYIRDTNKMPLQLFLRNILLRNQLGAMTGDNAIEDVGTTIKYATILVSVILV